jgi:predicted acetyltransferase
MITLPEPPHLVPPTTDVRISYLTGEQADMRHRGQDTAWLASASEDFDRFVVDRLGVRERWGVPSTLFWFVSGPHYLGTLVVRHRLLEGDEGGHIGYHVVWPWQHQGHARRMLMEGRLQAAALGVERALLTVAPTNAWSRKVVLDNGGVPDGRNADGEDRFLLPPVRP